jgi:hypothetical protein
MVIYPEVIVTPDRPTVRFNGPVDKIDLDKVIPAILQSQGWSCGTFFNVQFVNHERTVLIKSGQFVVTESSESLQTNDANPYQPMTRTAVNRKAEIIGDWWYPAVNKAETPVPKTEVAEPVKQRAAR